MRQPAFVLALLVTLLFPLVPASHADTVESVLMPGKVVAGHADLETDCKQCHVRFNKSAQSGLCLDCHKDVARDAIQKRGYHGRIKEQECRVCHTEHKGRDANIAPLDESRFDHRLTDFPLRGGHTSSKIRCRDCHQAGKKHRDAPSDCVACHRKDDTHKGKLGNRCADCHRDTRWKDTVFDHSKTRFPLTGKHREVGCRDCHKDPKFKGESTRCVACHRKDDDKRGHKGRFGQKCETCHVDSNWKTIRFDHDRDTKYPLRGKHRFAKCTTCHTGDLYRAKLRTTCAACHQKDDDRKGHKGRFGDKCQSCHVEKDWTATIFDHNRQTKYPLRGKHAQAKCQLCHTGVLYREKLQTDCFSCHRKDDKHKGQEGRQCARCHNERSWKDTRVDHGLTRFPLLGKHAKVECKKCHVTPAFRDAKVECVACHRKDDAHKLRLGTKCETCHNAVDWKRWEFDHDRRTTFKLDGGHRGLDCLACHRRPMDRTLSLSSSCASCHDDVDIHRGGFGRECQRCHYNDSWKKLRPRASLAPR